MIVTAEPRAARLWTVRQQAAMKRVAIVPTMGALHEGHLSLVRRAQQLADEVAVSIFVNPTQFAPSEDLARYPRPLADDLSALRDEGVAMVFHPTNDAIYPNGFSTFIEPPAVAALLEGMIRPGHFRGVCTVVLKLFQIVPASVAVFGQKDYQQSLVISAMVKDLNVPITIDIADTVREPDGLAMSSRNRYLSGSERKRALRLSQALHVAREQFQQGERHVAQIEAAMRDALQMGTADGVDSVDYAVVVDQETLSPFTTINTTAIALVAARLGSTRLIDNTVLAKPILSTL